MKSTTHSQIAERLADLHWTTKPPKPDRYLERVLDYLEIEATTRKVFLYPLGYDIAIFTNWVWFNGHIDPEVAEEYGVQTQFLMNVNLARVPTLFISRRLLRLMNCGPNLGRNQKLGAEAYHGEAFDQQDWLDCTINRLDNGYLRAFSDKELIPPSIIFQTIHGDPLTPLKTDVLCCPLIPTPLYDNHRAYMTRWGVLMESTPICLIPDEAHSRVSANAG